MLNFSASLAVRGAAPDTPERVLGQLRAPRSASLERRSDGRRDFTKSFANKYIDGIPHLVELRDLSSSGLRVRRILEPESAAQAYPLELMIGGITMWAWTRRVWRRGNLEALRIVSADWLDRARLQKFLRASCPA
jgi:hypothetical protein